MKKVLSMVLALALVLTTLVVPMTVSAAEGDVTVEYVISAVDKDNVTRTDGIYVGDTITVDVKVKGENVLMQGYEIYVPYSNIDVTADSIFEYSGAKYVKFISLDEDTTVTSEGVSVGTFTFSAPAAATGYEIQAVSSDLSNYVSSDWDVKTFVSEAGTYDVLAHTGQVKIEGTNVDVTLNDTTTSASRSLETVENLTIAVSSPSNATIENATLNGETITEDTKISAFGEYEIKFTTKEDGKEHKYTFTYKNAAQIDVAAAIDNTAGFIPGDTVDLEVSVEDLGDSKVEVVTFDLTYDSGVFTIGKAPDNVAITDGTDGVTKSVTWTAPSGSSLSGAGAQDVCTLTFTVNSDANVVATKDFKLTNEKVAVDGFAAEAQAVQELASNDTAYATIHNGVNTFDVTEPSTDWAQSKTANVAFATDWSGAAEVKYGVFDAAQENAKSAYEAAANTVTLTDANNIMINQAKVYQIVAQFGSEDGYVYQIIKTWAATDVKIDTFAPIVSMDAITDWANNAARATVTVKVNGTTDAESAVTKIEYAFTDGEDAAWAEATYTADTDEATVTLPTDAVVYEKIYVKATDAANNVSNVTSFDIYYDNVAPEVKITEVGTWDGEKATVTGTVDKKDSGSDLESAVKVEYKGTSEEATFVEIEDAGVTIANGEFTYDAESAGTYKFTAADKAGNTHSVEQYVDAESHSQLVAPTFQVVKNDNTKTGSFKTDAALGTLGLSTNGTFTYVKMIPGSTTDDKLVTTYKLMKGTEEIDTTNGIELEASTADGDYVLTVTTTYDKNENDTKSATYPFSIAEAHSQNFKTVNNDQKYQIIDYRIMKLLSQATDDTFKSAVTINAGADNERMLWTGGYFAGDVDGSLEAADWAIDANTLLTEMKEAKAWPQYEFELLNNVPAEEESAE